MVRTKTGSWLPTKTEKNISAHHNPKQQTTQKEIRAFKGQYNFVGNQAKVKYTKLEAMRKNVKNFIVKQIGKQKSHIGGWQVHQNYHEFRAYSKALKRNGHVLMGLKKQNMSGCEWADSLSYDFGLTHMSLLPSTGNRTPAL